MLKNRITALENHCKKNKQVDYYVVMPDFDDLDYCITTYMGTRLSNGKFIYIEALKSEVRELSRRNKE